RGGRPVSRAERRRGAHRARAASAADRVGGCGLAEARRRSRAVRRRTTDRGQDHRSDRGVTVRCRFAPHNPRRSEMQETSKIWMNGELVDWADATIHVGSHGLHYGSGVFEGMRAYETPRGTAVFRLTEHLDRLENSAKLLYMDLPYTTEELK